MRVKSFRLFEQHSTREQSVDDVNVQLEGGDAGKPPPGGFFSGTPVPGAGSLGKTKPTPTEMSYAPAQKSGLGFACIHEYEFVPIEAPVALARW